RFILGQEGNSVFFGRRLHFGRCDIWVDAPHECGPQRESGKSHLLYTISGRSVPTLPKPVSPRPESSRGASESAPLADSGRGETGIPSGFTSSAPTPAAPRRAPAA